MELALGLGALFVGAGMILAGVKKRSLGRLLFGYWDAPGSDTSAPAPQLPGNAATGGVHAPSPGGGSVVKTR